MKPKPTSSMHSATAPGSRSMRAPSASRTSADPERPVAERLPCFATAQPAPAATNAAVVETLKVGRPPPVPAVSSRSSRATVTPIARSRIVRARPTSASTVSPFVRSAIRKAADCASEASPSMIWRSTAAASAADRSSPEATRSMASVRTGLGIRGEEILEQGLAIGGEHRLGVKLDALGGQLAVTDGHDRVAVPGGSLEAVGKVGVHDQRVVAPGHERGFEAAEDRPAVVLDARRLAVDGLASHDSAAERLRHRLVAEADAQHRDAGLRQRGDRRHGHAGLRRGARTRRHDRLVGAAVDQLLDACHVVANHVELRPQLAQVLDEVVGERVVVVEDQDPHAQSACAHASSIAALTARDFASVSRTSYCGSESATIPPPACRYTRPSLITAERMKMQVSRSPVYER